MTLSKMQAFLEAERRTFLERCTACGACVRACPMLPHLEIKDVAPEATAGGLLALLRGEYDRAGAIFADACSGSARCREACPEGLDASHLMRMGKLAIAALGVAEGVSTPPRPRDFFRMIDVSLGLQVPKQQVRWFTGRPPRGVTAEVVFYLGCNILRTPHIALSLMDVLDRMGVDFHAIGGGRNCCGVQQLREGNLAATDAVSSNTFANLAAFSPKQVITWCPTCELHFNDFGATYLERSFPILHATRFLVERLEQFRAQIVQPIGARVALDVHARLGDEASVAEDARTLLRAIPGMEVVDIPPHGYGYHCAAIANRSASAAALGSLCQAAASAGVDYLVTIYHACHRDLARADERYPFQVVNLASLLGRACGVEREDQYKRYKLLGDPEVILPDFLARAGEHGRDLDEVRRALRWEFGRP